MSSALHPLDKSLTGLSKPWQSGPYASAWANLCVSLYPIFPAFKSGNTKILAFPFIGLPGAFLSATSGIIAASNCNSPSKSKSGAFSCASLVASTTFSVSSEWALPFVEYESIAILGVPSGFTNSIKDSLEVIAISESWSAVGFSFMPLSA